jgi:tetratricopeptide (TPR) repeat protein
MKDSFHPFLLSRFTRLSILSYFLLLSFSSIAFAHGDLDERIDAASLLIKQWPDSAELYVQRAALYFQHVEYTKALADIDQSRALGNNNSTALIIKSKSEHGLGFYEEALTSIDSYLQENDHVVALRLKGRILFDMSDFEKAADNFLAVISKANVTFPENYLETSIAYERSGNMRSAVSIVQEGIDRLGQVYALTDRLIELHLNNDDFDLALAVQQRLIDSSKRKEGPLYKAAMICLKAKKYEQAEEYLRGASVELNSLPKHIRLNNAMQELKSNIAESLTNLNSK